MKDRTPTERGCGVSVSTNKNRSHSSNRSRERRSNNKGYRPRKLDKSPTPVGDPP